MQQTAKKSIMIQLTVHSNIQVYGAISNLAGLITETGERAKDVLICSAESGIERIENIIRDNINRAVRPYINPIYRLY